MNAFTDAVFAAQRAALIAQAEELLDQTGTASGVTILIRRPDGSLEELYVPKRFSAARSKRRPS